MFSNNILATWKSNKHRWYWVLLFTGLLFIYGEFIFWFLGSIFRYKRYEILMVMVAVTFLIFRKLKFPSVKKSSNGTVLGSYLLLASLLFFMLGKFSNIETLQILGLVVVIFSLSLMIAGIEMAKMLIVPISYFLISYTIFEFPVNGELIATINYNLQLFTAAISNFILRLMKIQVVQDWEYVDLPHITLYVGPSCSGFNHILAIFLLAVPLAFTGNKKIKHQFILLLIAFFIGLIMNGLRVSAIAIWSFFYGNVSFHGPNDIFLVVSVFISGSIILMVISFKIDQKVKTQRPGLLREQKRKTFSRPQSRMMKIVSLSAIAMAIILPVFLNIKEVCLKQELAFISEFLKKWHSIEVQNTNPELVADKCDRFLQQFYSNDDGDTVAIQIIYLAKQNPRKKLTDYMPFSWTNISKTVYIIDPETPNLKINESYTLRDPEQPTTYSWYQLRERILTSWLSVKLYSLWNTLWYQTTNGALIKITIKPNVNIDLRQRKDYEYQLLEQLVPIISHDMQNLLTSH